MMVVLEKKTPDGTVRPYILGWAEAGMRAASGGSEQASVSGASHKGRCIEYGEAPVLSLTDSIEYGCTSSN